MTGDKGNVNKLLINGPAEGPPGIPNQACNRALVIKLSRIQFVVPLLRLRSTILQLAGFDSQSNQSLTSWFRRVKSNALLSPYLRLYARLTNIESNKPDYDADRLCAVSHVTRTLHTCYTTSR
jgi:hypothetical protein